jgi:hypothetical protein
MRLFLLGLWPLLLGSQSALASVDYALLSIVPPSATVIAGIDVRRAVTSRSGTYMLEQTVADQQFAGLVSATGLNVRRDVRQMLLVGTGRQSTTDSPHAVIAHGTFDPARLIAAGQLRGASIRRYRAFAILVQGTGKAVEAIAFPSAEFLVMGDLATVEAVLASGGQSGGINPVLRGQVNRIGPGNDVWFATALSGAYLVQQLGDALPEQLRTSDVLERISRSSGGLQFSQTDKLTLDLVAHSPGDARFLSGLLQLAGSLGHLQIGGNAGLALAESVLSSMQVGSQGSTVHAASAVPDAQLERALKSSS